MAGSLIIQPLTAQGGVNWIFLIEILVCAILAVFFLFYSNRLFATLVSYCIRAYTWHKYKAYIDITSLQISLLGGRVFFKSIRYHAHNVTCLVHEGHITWRYWLASVQEAEVFTHRDERHKDIERSNSVTNSEDEEKSSSEERQTEKTRSRSVGKAETGGIKPKRDLPCRISVKVSGVEAFVYNRSPSYDAVLEQILRKSQRPRSAPSNDEHEKREADSAPSGYGNEEKRHRFGWSKKHGSSSASPSGPKIIREKQEKAEPPAFLRLFPLKVECRRAAATLGNDNTTNVVIAKVERAVGTIGAGHAGPIDLYRLLFNFDMEKCNATMRPNRDFKQLQLDAAQRILRDREAGHTPRQRFNFVFLQRIRAGLQGLLSRFSRAENTARSLRTASVKSGVQGSHLDGVDTMPPQAQWTGLDRYMEEKELDQHDEWKDVEYAKASTLADINKLNMNFYFDMPGIVQESIDLTNTAENSEYEDDMNGAKPPAYGMEFAVYGGVVTYGPWADRQRLNIQQIFFPASYVDAVPSAALKPGDTRNWTVFNIFISIEEDVTLRIPSRELSKDDKWQGRSNKMAPAGNQQSEASKQKGKRGRKYKHSRRNKSKQGAPGLDARPYGWLDITVKTDTTVRYVMDMFPRRQGYRNSLDVDCKATEINSSVNHGLLWRTGPISVVADLSQATHWNTVRKWPFEITINDMELFILRDHLFLIIDLVNDWSYGPPVDFYTFVPYIYSLRLLFRNFVMYLNVNDANIINDADNFDKNDFLTLEGFLDSTLNINMDQYRPVRNMITFDVLAQNLRMRMLSPPKSTFSLLLKDKVVADLPKLTLYGSYSGHIEERPGLVDALRFDIVGSGLTLKAYGFLVRQLINLKENYFGDYMHFKTLEEFQGADEDLAIANVKTASLPKPKFINELDVMLCIVAEDVTVLLPTNLYSPGNFVRAELPVANLDLRIVSYYLDMGLQLSPVTFFSGAPTSGEDSPMESTSQTQFFVKHVNLDGHRSFGLPPNEPPYISQWDIDIGAITGEFSSSFIHDLAMGARAFVFGFQDGENALPLPGPSIFYEATFVQVRTDLLRLWFHVGKDALLLSADPVEVVTNDWARDVFSQRVSIVAPKLTVACVDARSASRHRVGEKRRVPVRTYAFFQTGAAVSVILRKPNFEDATQKQQSFIRENDQRTHRAPFLIRHPNQAVAEQDTEFYPPTMPYPSMPSPLDHTGYITSRPASVNSIPTYTGQHGVRSKASSSSLSASLRKESLAVPTIADYGHREQPSGPPSSHESIRSGSSASSIKSSAPIRSKPAPTGELGSLGLPPSTIAFSSSFAEPYFPLDMVEPDETNVPNFDFVPPSDDTESDAASMSEMIDAPSTDDDVAQISVLIHVSPGIRGYLEPRVVETGAKLFRKILPKSPEEVMDAFQMDVMSAVVAKQQAEHGTGQLLEIQVALPAARLRAVNPGPSSDTNDQFDIGLQSVNTLVRMRNMPSASGPREVLAVHATAQDVDASLGRPESLRTVGSAVNAHVDDVLVWVASAAARSIHANAGDTTLSISGEQAESIVDFVIRLMPLATSLNAKVEVPLETRRNRLLVLIYALTQHGEEIGDPAYLSRITYILRAFPDHFRNSESWKVVSRFRHILQNLDPKIFDELGGKIKQAKLDCPADAPAHALDEWAQWQNWDVPNVHQTVAFQLLFSEEEGKAMHAPEDIPLLLTVRSDYLRIAVEADKAANEIVIRQTTVGVESTPPTAPTGLMLVDENTRKKTMVQMHSNSIALLANWSAFSIAERVLAFKDKLEQLPLPNPQAEQPLSASQRFEDSLYRHIFQVAISTDSGSISLQSINLRHISRADGLKLSLIGTTQADQERYGPCATAIVNADTAVTELFSDVTPIWRTNLLSPSIYADHVRPLATTEEPPSTYIAVGYKVLELGLLEQMPGLLRIVDSVVLDEVSKIMNLVQSTTPADASEKQIPVSVKSNAPSSPVKIHVALLAGDLSVEVSLLQSVKYHLTGTAASVRLAPSMREDQAWAIDFDVGGQSHRFLNPTSKMHKEQNILDVPPINGHVGVALGSEATSLSVAATMERVEVNAAAIQGVAATLNQPEIKNVISAIKSGIEDIRGHILEIVPRASTTPKKTKNAEKPLALDVRFALLGIRMAAITKRATGGSIHVEFGIGPLHLIASNRDVMAKSKLLLPEVRTQIRDIGARLQIHEHDRYEPCGHITFGLDIHFKSFIDKNGNLARTLKAQSQALEVYAYPHTASTAVEVINYMQERLKSLDLSKEIEYLHRLGDARKGRMIQKISGREVITDEGEVAFSAEDLLSISTTVQFHHIRATWVVDQMYASSPNARISDLVLGMERIEFTTRGGREARLTIENTQLSLTKKSAAVKLRSLNSALLPEMTFSVGYWSVGSNRSLTFKAAGKPLELRLESRFIVPVNALSKSINAAIEQYRSGTAAWKKTAQTTTTEAPRANILDTKRIASVLVEADFAGAQFYVQGSGPSESSLSTLTASSQKQGAQHGRYGQFAADGAGMQTMLKAPGIAMKIEYNAASDGRPPTLNAEVKIDASSNMVLPNVVPLLLEVSHSVREVMKSQQQSQGVTDSTTPTESRSVQKLLEDDSIIVADPAVLFGKIKLDIGFRICRQEFGLTCQPIARVDAKAELDDFYFTVNTIQSDEHGHFFAITAVVTKLGASVKHVYSREPSFTYQMDSIVLSVMNSKHLSGEPGISAILKINPTRTFINGKQLQDLLLFREIWMPPEIRTSSASNTRPSATRQDEFFMQKYRAAAAAAAFPWNATVSIAELGIDLDLGQSIGKSSFSITNLWASQTKSSRFEQNLCIGMDEMAMNSTGRMSGFIRLTKLGVRTSISWPQDVSGRQTTPLIQASLGFGRLLTKAAFDYQAFAFGDIEGFDFLMYNVHQPHGGSRDRLVAVLDCEKAYVFCTSTSPARAVGLYQAFDRLVQEKQAAFKRSLMDIEKYVRRESTLVPTRFGPAIPESPTAERSKKRGVISMHTDVVLTIGAISFGVYPGTFFDSQILKLEAKTIQARFAAGLERSKIASSLGMTLGQLEVALASVKRATAVPKALDISVDEVVSNAINAKGGTILRVPKVVASMQTWQASNSKSVDYIFKSLFDGKIDVGWNLSRIDFIKNMWTAHTRSLASRLGKALPESAVKITAGPAKEHATGVSGDQSHGQGKITAEVYLPQARYDYKALETPIIETPQLRDMGEATPPLEWIGLHRDRLPNVTHQIIIVSLLEVVKEVEDAYKSILGSSA